MRRNFGAKNIASPFSRRGNFGAKNIAAPLASPGMSALTISPGGLLVAGSGYFSVILILGAMAALAVREGWFARAVRESDPRGLFCESGPRKPVVLEARSARAVREQTV